MSTIATKGWNNDSHQLLNHVHFVLEGFLHDFIFSGGKNRRPIEIQCPDEEVSYVKFQLESCDFFHLERISLIGYDGADIGLTPGVSEVTASSAFEDTAWMLQNRAIITGQRAEMAFGFHTKCESQPWMCVKMASQIKIRRISIYNRTDDPAVSRRALPLTVYTSRDGIHWTLLHDQRILLSGLRSGLKQALQRLDPTNEAVTDLGLDLLWYWYTQDLEALNAKWQEYMLSEIRTEEQRNAVRYINSNILANHELELTAHGLLRSFRFWSDSEKHRYMQLAARTCAALQEFSSDVCLGFGSALGICREGDFLQHDDDIDILVAFPRETVSNFSKALEYVRQFLAHSEFRIEGFFKSHLWVIDAADFKLDIFVGIIEGDYVSFFPGPRKSILNKSVFPARNVVVCGVEVPIPNSPDDYLSQVYGPDWKIPQSAWRHTWDSTDFSDLL